MPAEVLVMCPSCARPQFPAAVCVACATPLPEISAAETQPSGRDRILESYQPHLEASLGRGRTLLLSERRLEWKNAKDDAGHQVKLEALESVGMRIRPIWEALLFVPVFLVFVMSPWPLARIAGALLIALAVAACFLQRRFALVLTSRSGKAERWVLGFGRPGTPPVERIQSVWASLSEALLRQGVSVQERL